MHEVLVNRLGGLSLPRKNVVRLTDHRDMTIDVYCGRKTTMQEQQQQHQPGKQKIILEFIFVTPSYLKQLVYVVNISVFLLNSLLNLQMLIEKF